LKRNAQDAYPNGMPGQIKQQLKEPTTKVANTTTTTTTITWPAVKSSELQFAFCSTDFSFQIPEIQEANNFFTVQMVSLFFTLQERGRERERESLRVRGG